MSSVEQKIREVLENISGSGGVKSIAIDQATQSILQIIKSAVGLNKKMAGNLKYLNGKGCLYDQ